MDIAQIRQDFAEGMTDREVMDKHNITIEQEYAIIYGTHPMMSDEHIQERIKQVKPGMSSLEIRSLMYRGL